MKKFKLSEAGDRGWFIGAFDRAIWRTDAFEVSYQFNPKGDTSHAHLHKVARELSLITQGRVIANGVEMGPGDLFEILPNEVLHCEYLEDTYTICVKEPSVLGDKYYV